MTPEALARELESFLAEARAAVVYEGEAQIFDLAEARYSISNDRGKCLLHLWSTERNIVRRVLETEQKNGSLRLQVQRFGQSKPQVLEIVHERDRRSATARRGARSAYQQRLKRVLEKSFPDLSLVQLSSTMDLEHSFSPVYARGMMQRGRSGFAVLGVNSEETQASIDGALTFALLWFDHLRQRHAAKRLIEGLKVVVPVGSGAVVRERMANLDHAAAKFELYEFDERAMELLPLDCADRGNIATRLTHCPDDVQVRERFQVSIEKVLSVVPAAEVAVLNATEIAFRLHGLEFARVRVALQSGSFRTQEELTFGTGAFERVLDGSSEPLFVDLMRRVVAVRRAGGDRREALWRMHPERWLESLVMRDVSLIDPRLDSRVRYSQVPAFSASDRAMIDVLTCTREGRLAVIELKADEDIHLPMQGLDYWARVRWHHARCEFQKFGYFPGRELSEEPPMLLLVAPALRVHPATDTLLRYFSREIDWTLVGIDERWREDVRVVFRKRRDES